MRKAHPSRRSSTKLKGASEFRAVLGPEGKRVYDSLNISFPDLARLLVEFPFGEIYVRPALGRKTRELIAIAALATKGNAMPQLKMHVHGALHCGCSKEEVLEVLLMMTSLCGFPRGVERRSCCLRGLRRKCTQSKRRFIEVRIAFTYSRTNLMG